MARPNHLLMQRKNDETSLKDALMALLKSYRLERGYHLTKIQKVWPKRMGPVVAGYTREIRLRGKTLFIHLDSAPLRQELSLGKEKIRQMLNEELGEPFIKEVRLL